LEYGNQNKAMGMMMSLLHMHTSSLAHYSHRTKTYSLPYNKNCDWWIYPWAVM